MKNSSNKTLITVFTFLVLVGIAGLAYWYFLMRPAGVSVTPGQQGTGGQQGFQPLGGSGGLSGSSGGTPSGANGNSAQNGTTTAVGGARWQPPVLRSLSSSPIGGYGVLDAGATTTVRWVDRGRGNVYEANYSTPNIVTLSNTLVPRIYESVWSAGLTSFIGSLLQDGSMVPTTVYAQLIKQAASSNSASTSLAANGGVLTPYLLRGKNISGDMIGYAVSPDKSKIFMLMEESGNGAGYVSNFDGSGTVKIFSTPLTALNVDWPTTNAISLVTKGSASYGGFMYFVNPRTGTWTKELGPLPGLSAVASHDGKYILASYSSGNGNGLSTGIYDVSKGTMADAVIQTLADKCAWGNFYKDVVYCAVPSQLPSGTYPDDWYKGVVSTIDKIWQVDATTGQVRLMSSIVDEISKVINAEDVSLDANDAYLFFMNKNDLSLWSLDLARSQGQ